MAQTFTEVLTTPAQVGKVRDVSKIINNLDKDETPTLTMIGQGKKATNVRTEWETRSLPTYDADTAKSQGQKAAPTASTQPAIMSNEQMIFEDTVSVSYTSERQKQYNIKNKMADQVQLKTTAMKIACNKRVVGNYGSQEATAANNEQGKFASMLAFMTGDNVSHGSGHADGGYNSTTKVTTAYTPGTARALTEQIFLDTTKAIAKGRKKANYDAICNADVRSFVSQNFNGVVPLTQEVGSDVGNIGLAGSVAFVRHDYGVTRFHYDHTAPNDAMPIINRKLWKMRPFWDWMTQDLAKTGLSSEKQVSKSVTLEATNPEGSGAIVDIL